MRLNAQGSEGVHLSEVGGPGTHCYLGCEVLRWGAQLPMLTGGLT